MLYWTLTVLAAVLGLAVTGSAVYMAWSVHQLRGQGSGQEKAVQRALVRWTVFDYALLILVLAGLLFLLADLIGVLKDRELYPYYHYGYLLSGFVFSLVGLLFLLARLFMVLRLANPDSSAPDKSHKPDQADHAEQGI